MFLWIVKVVVDAHDEVQRALLDRRGDENLSDATCEVRL